MSGPSVPGPGLSEFSRRVLAALRERGWAAPGARWIAATSGGPDSTALAAALAELIAAGELEAELALAHFDHAIRPDSARDAEWVGRLATRLRAVFLTERGDVPALARDEGLGVEEAARKARLAFLERTARSWGATRVATGHTADDQAETVLFRIMRGTGIKGLAGIPPERPISPESPDVLLVRPMLGIGRAEVLAYLEEQGFEHLTDPTNRDVANQARARIRHETLPALEERLRRFHRDHGGA
jgi:tRNA(Ile)-lysidine synthase